MGATLTKERASESTDERRGNVGNEEPYHEEIASHMGSESCAFGTPMKRSVPAPLREDVGKC